MVGRTPGRPPGPRGSPWTRFSPTKSAHSARSKPTGASAADQGSAPPFKQNAREWETKRHWAKAPAHQSIPRSVVRRGGHLVRFEDYEGLETRTPVCCFRAAGCAGPPTCCSRCASAWWVRSAAAAGSGGRRPFAAQRLLLRRRGRRRSGRPPTAGGSWLPISDGQLKTGSVGASRWPIPTQRDLRRHGRSLRARQRLQRRRRLQVGRRRQDLAQRGAAGQPDHRRRASSIRRIPTSCTSPRSAICGGRTRCAACIRTTDGGATWKQVLTRGPDAGAVDLAMDPSNPRVLYAAFWQVRRNP